MDAAKMAAKYKSQQILTSSPEQLTLMLYNGAIRFIDESMIAIDKKDLQKSHNANMRAQDIVREFIATLDMSYDIAKGYYQLYDYVEFRLIQANLKKDKSQLEEAKQILVELRDAWEQAMKLVRNEQATVR
ncbi:flagellar export chaperone FliS [Desulfitobacterium sp. AusDCA]|uniref:flagellar export chaperone FliS n=1 Tax=Desulfitobacterium sp. AusDCA TaxID=3240383 RepID=UPI003DA7010A